MNHQITIPANNSRLVIIKAFIVFLWELPKDKAFDVAVTVSDRSRTLTQNKAMHKYFKLLSDKFNDAGYTVQKVLTKPLEISWTESLVKGLLWKQIQDAMYDKESTARLSTNEVSKVYEELNNYTASKLGVHVDFPSKDRL